MRPRPRHGGAAVSIAVSLIALTAGLAAPSAAAADGGARPPASAVTAAEDSAARAVAGSLSDRRWSARVREAALGSREVPVTDLAARADDGLHFVLKDADRRILAAKGLAPDTGSLLRLRLGADSMRAALSAGRTPWVAAAGADDPDYVDSWYTLAQGDTGTRYGARGNGWMLEPYFVEQF
ncbi:hypothetical protein ACJ6WF_28945 [Streptomyces sp. MMS24-I2-30]|uniref:hypothetical protein n=1 Tax=Streptomyces sp. MMS24-I2-30 TaxID=3351564 RepID=UPI003896CE6F